MAANGDDLVISVSTDTSTIKRQLTQLGQDIGQTTSKISNQFETMGKSIDASMTPMQKRINGLVGIPVASKVKEWTGALATSSGTLDKVGHSAEHVSTSMQAMMHATRSMGEQLAMGVPITQALTGQLSHLSYVASQPGGITGALKQMGEMALGIVTKFPWVTAAVVAAGAAFAVYEMVGGKTVATVDEALAEHAKTIKALRDAYGLAGDGADDYARRSIAAIESAQRRAEAALRESVAAADKQAKSALSDNGGYSGFGILQQLGLAGDSDLNAVKTKFAAFAEPIRKLREEIKAGKPDYDAFQQSLDAIAATNPGHLRAIADEILSLIDPAAKGHDALDNMSVALNGLSQTQIETAHNVAKIHDIEAAAFSANQEVKGFLMLLKSMDTFATGKGDAVGGKGSLDRAQDSFNDQLALWRRFGHDKDAGLTMPDPKKAKGSKTPSITADDQFNNDLQAIKDRTAALLEEQNALGLTYEQEVKRKTALTLEQTALKQVREEARKKGDADWQNAQLTPDQIKKIDEVSAAYARQAEQLKEAQAAQQLQRDILQGVFDDLKTALESGKLSWQTFGNIALGVLDKIITKIETDLIDSIMQANNASGGGGGIFGSILGMLTGGGGGGFQVTPGYVGTYADGGFTGPGGKNDPAGIVHKGEYVFDQDAVKRIGVGNLRRLQKGYADGGYVGGVDAPVMPSIASRGGGSAGYNDNRKISIDARGAQQGVGEEIKRALAEYDKSSVPRTLSALRTAKQRGMV